VRTASLRQSSHTCLRGTTALGCFKTAQFGSAALAENRSVLLPAAASARCSSRRRSYPSQGDRTAACVPATGYFFTTAAIATSCTPTQPSPIEGRACCLSPRFYTAAHSLPPSTRTKFSLAAAQPSRVIFRRKVRRPRVERQAQDGLGRICWICKDGPISGAALPRRSRSVQPLDFPWNRD
jgi:hypothetical protein